MRENRHSVAAAALACAGLWSLPAAAGDHAYFDALVARPEHYRSYSLRDPAQLARRKDGGYAQCNSCPLDVNYLYPNDPDPRMQDAAKVVVPEGNNSLPNQVWLPLETEDGHTYLTTWDAWFGSELRRSLTGLTNWKTFQFRARKSPGGSAGIWFEVRSRFDGGTDPWKLTLDPDTEVAAVDARGYSAFGPNVEKDQPLSPQLGTMAIEAETWTRYWMLVEQNANDWDLVSLWVADEDTDPVQIVDRLQFETHGLVDHFDLEFNTSTSTVKEGRGPLVSYVKNIAVLRDVSDPVSLFQRPTSDGSVQPFPDGGGMGGTAGVAGGAGTAGSGAGGSAAGASGTPGSGGGGDLEPAGESSGSEGCACRTPSRARGGERALGLLTLLSLALLSRRARSSPRPRSSV